MSTTGCAACRNYWTRASLGFEFACIGTHTHPWAKDWVDLLCADHEVELAAAILKQEDAR